MAVRAKFKCVDVVDLEGDTKKPPDDRLQTIRLEPVISGSPENDEFWKLTPGGSIELSTINPAAANQFDVGKEYYVDFTPAN